MPTFDDLIAAGDPVDPDLVSLLAAEGVDTVEDAHALGAAHWLSFFAERDGFSRDFLDLPGELGLSWEQAADAPAMARPVEDLEIGVPAMGILQKLGIENLAEVYRRPRAEIEAAMGERSGMLGELRDVVARAGLSW